MFKYLLVDQAVPAMCRSLAAARLRADWPSGKAPQVRRPIDVLDLTGIAHIRAMRALSQLVAPMRQGDVGAVLFDQPVDPILTEATALGAISA
jgi:hypothetical protein